MSHHHGHNNSERPSEKHKHCEKIKRQCVKNQSVQESHISSMTAESLDVLPKCDFKLCSV